WRGSTVTSVPPACTKQEMADCASTHRTAWTAKPPTCWGPAGRRGKAGAGRSTSGCETKQGAPGKKQKADFCSLLPAQCSVPHDLSDLAHTKIRKPDGVVRVHRHLAHLRRAAGNRIARHLAVRWVELHQVVDR